MKLSNIWGYVRGQYEEMSIAPGSGKLTAAISIGLGFLALLGSLCFLFPNLLTMPELRGVYHYATMKTILFTAIIIAFVTGYLSFYRNPFPRYGLIGMSLSAAAALLSSGVIPANRIEIPFIYAGLDYFILTLVILALVFIPLEKAFPQHKNQMLLRKGWVSDIKYFMFSHVGIQLISFVTIIPIQFFLKDYTQFALQNWIRSLPIFVQFLMILAVVDFGTYWIHRKMHEVRWLWKVHAIHHSSAHMDWLASSRLHIVEIVMNRFAGYLPIFVLGFSPTALFIYLVFVSFHAIFIHANVRFKFPVVRWLLATPQFHHWHHSSEDAALDKNYAAFLPIYDVMFGTCYLPKHWPKSFGTTAADAVPEGMVDQFWYPLKFWKKRIKKRFASESS